MGPPGVHLFSNKIGIIQIGPTGEKLCVNTHKKNIQVELRTSFLKSVEKTVNGYFVGRNEVEYGIESKGRELGKMYCLPKTRGSVEEEQNVKGVDDKSQCS